jgi:hypothetical protein
MDTSLLVSDKIKAGSDLLTQLLNRQFPVECAGWVKTDPEGRWKLYIVWPNSRSTVSSWPDTIQKINSVMRDERIDLSPFNFSVIDLNHPFAIGFRDAVSWLGDKTGMWYSGPRLGNEYIDGAYVYSVPVPQAA